MKIVSTSDAGAVVAIDRADEVEHAVHFHMQTLQQPLLGLRFPHWVALVHASLALKRARVAHRISSITETKEEFFAAHEFAALHLFLDDPPGTVALGCVELQPTDGEAAAHAMGLLWTHAYQGGALGAWGLPGGTVYRLASANGHAVAIRRASAIERSRGLGFVHLFLLCPNSSVVVSCGWPEDAQLDAELVDAEARLAALAAAKGDA